MKTIEQIEAEIAALQAEREARKSEPDLREAVKAFENIYHERLGTAANALIAAYPALYKVLGPRPPWPSDDMLQGTAESITVGYPHAAAMQMARLLKKWQVAQVAAPEPTEAEDLAMAQEVYRSLEYLDHVTDVIVAAFKAERKRAGGGK